MFLGLLVVKDLSLFISTYQFTMMVQPNIYETIDFST